MGNLKPNISPDTGITWSDLTRIIAAESPILLTSNDKPLIAERSLVSLNRSTESDDYESSQSLIEEIDNILHAPRFRMNISNVESNQEPSLVSKSELLGQLKKATAESKSINESAFKINPKDAEFIGKSIVKSDEILKLEIADHQSIINAIETNDDQDDSHSTNRLLINKLEDLIKIKKLALSTGSTDLTNDSPENDRTKRILQSERARRLYYMMASSQKSTNELSLRLTKDIVKVASDTRLYFFMRELSRKKISLSQIASKIEILTQNTDTRESTTTARNVLLELAPLIQLISQYKHVEVGNTSTSMGAITKNEAVCASKTRLLADLLHEIPYFDTHEVVPIIRTDGGSLGHVFVGITLGKDVYVEIEPSGKPDPSNALQVEVGCQTNIFVKNDNKPINAKSMLQRMNTLPNNTVYVRQDGEVYEYHSENISGAHKYVELSDVFPNSTYNQAIDTYTYLHAIDLYDKPISRKDKALLIKELENLLMWELTTAPNINTYRMISKIYDDPLFQAGKDDETLVLNRNRGLYSAYRYLQANPFDIFAYKRYIEYLDQFYFQDGVQEHNSRRMAIYCEMVQTVEQAQLINKEGLVTSSYKERLSEQLQDPKYQSEREYIDRYPSDKRLFIQLSAKNIWSSNFSPETKDALTNFR